MVKLGEFVRLEILDRRGRVMVPSIILQFGIPCAVLLRRV